MEGVPIRRVKMSKRQVTVEPASDTDDDVNNLLESVKNSEIAN